MDKSIPYHPRSLLNHSLCLFSFIACLIFVFIRSMQKDQKVGILSARQHYSGIVKSVIRFCKAKNVVRIFIKVPSASHSFYN